jgi:hypothetical protein
MILHKYEQYIVLYANFFHIRSIKEAMWQVLVKMATNSRRESYII